MSRASIAREIELDTSRRTTAPKRRRRSSDSTASSRSSASSEISVSPSRVSRNERPLRRSPSPGTASRRKCAITVSSGTSTPRSPTATKRSRPSGTLTRANRSSPDSGSRTIDAEAQRQPGDVRERLARPDRERRQDGVDLPREERLELGALLRRRSRRRCRRRCPRRRARGRELVAPQASSARRSARAPLADLGERLLRRAPVGRANRQPRDDLVEQAGHAHHEELVEDRRDDPAELHALEERLVRVGRRARAPARIRSSCESSRFRSGCAGASDRRRVVDTRPASPNPGERWVTSLVTPALPDPSRRHAGPYAAARCGTTVSSSALAIVLGIILIVVAVVYWAEPAKSLPELLPRARRPGRATTTSSTGSRRSSSGSPASPSPGSAPGRSAHRAT